MVALPAEIVRENLDLDWFAIGRFDLVSVNTPVVVAAGEFWAPGDLARKGVVIFRRLW